MIPAIFATAAALGGVLLRAGRGRQSVLGAPGDLVASSARRSPRYAAGTFRNTLPSAPTPTPTPETEESFLRALLRRGRIGGPAGRIPLAETPTPVAAADLAVTWYGHSSVLLEVDGRRVLTDPVWGQRASPLRRVGPRRMHPAPVPLSELPPIDAVLISHDHYDHLDLSTIRDLLEGTAATFVVPLGVGAHLRTWGASADRVIELDWDERADVAGLRITCTEARHFSGRWLTSRDSTLWSSWVIAGPTQRAFFGGDTGYCPAFAEIGDRHGPFGLTVLPIGAYDRRWPDIHLNPEEAVQVHQDLQAGNPQPGLLVPVHWATFNLGFHPWGEPADRLRVAAEQAAVPIAMPVPGERVNANQPPPLRDWWSPLQRW